MTPWLEIILSVAGEGAKCSVTVDSLLAQSASGFGVVLGDGGENGERLVATRARLDAGGIAARCVSPPFKAGRVMLANWTHAQARAAWLKPLRAGDTLKPDTVQRLHEHVTRRPAAQLIRMGGELPAGAPATLTPGDFLAHFPPRGGWPGGAGEFAFQRAAWCALGGYAPQFAACAESHLCLMLALHHGCDQLAGSLVNCGGDEEVALCWRRALEWRLVMKQAQIFCHNAKLPWPPRPVSR
ncbi:MAG: hypothetical protein HY301_18960 [Verrucomicrobia bacterium]|nr:hypothetical protein [Verrucomicrobiota bacterium]